MIVARINNISRLCHSGQSLLILGPRGSGKSFYIGQILKTFSHPVLKIDLLASDKYKLYSANPSILYSEIVSQIGLLEKKRLTVFIDEIQRIPDLLNEVHRLIEEFKPELNFILTGSSARKLKRSGANLLAGRALLIDFFPFNHKEIDFKNSLATILQWGLLPEIFLESSSNIRKLRLETYVKTYLNEEIKAESDIRNLDGFSRFLDIAAQLNATPVNFSKIGRLAGVSPNSVRAYYEILEDTLIAYRVPAWTQSKVKQLIQSAKYYLFDNGVVNFLCGDSESTPRESTNRYGKLYENLVVSEIIRYNSLNSCGVNYYHYRTNNGSEIDLILQKNAFSAPIAIEIKSSTNPENVSKTMLEFKREHQNAKLFVLSRKELRHTDQEINYLNFPDGLEEIFEKA